MLQQLAVPVQQLVDDGLLQQPEGCGQRSSERVQHRWRAQPGTSADGEHVVAPRAGGLGCASSAPSLCGALESSLLGFPAPPTRAEYTPNPHKLQSNTTTADATAILALLDQYGPFLLVKLERVQKRVGYRANVIRIELRFLKGEEGGGKRPCQIQ